MGKVAVKDSVIRGFIRKARKHHNITTALLFGSRAKGEELKSSDYDVLLVSPDFEGKRFTERAAEVVLKCGVNFAMDLLCYTLREFEEKRRQLGIVSLLFFK